MMWLLIIWFTVGNVAQIPVVVDTFTSKDACNAAYKQIVDIKPQDVTITRAECNAITDHT